jgi:hypothetical protein
VCALILTAGMAASALATTALRPLSVDEMATRADLIVRGQVDRIDSYKDGDKIYTNIDVAIAETWKGEAETTTVRIRVYGGVADGRRTIVIGAPCWDPGEEAVLFLVGNGPGTFDVLSLAEGKFRLDAGAAERDLTGIAFAQPSLEPMPATVDELKDAVTAALR